MIRVTVAFVAGVATGALASLGWWLLCQEADDYERRMLDEAEARRRLVSHEEWGPGR